jgi:hypothetical protein
MGVTGAFGGIEAFGRYFSTATGVFLGQEFIADSKDFLSRSSMVKLQRHFVIITDSARKHLPVLVLA